MKVTRILMVLALVGSFHANATTGETSNPNCATQNKTKLTDSAANDNSAVDDALGADNSNNNGNSNPDETPSAG